MTPQEMFNESYIGVVTQGGPSVSDEGLCRYRGEGGTKCGVGHLIDDETASVWDMQDKPSISSIIRLGNLKVPNFIKDNEVLARGIQKSHDIAYTNLRFGDEDFMLTFKNNMEKVAKDFDLTIPVME